MADRRLRLLVEVGTSDLVREFKVIGLAFIRARSALACDGSQMGFAKGWLGVIVTEDDKSDSDLSLHLFRGRIPPTSLWDLAGQASNGVDYLVPRSVTTGP